MDPKHAHAHDHGHDHAAPPRIDRAQHLARAAALCADAGESLTPLRRRVLELLIDAGGPAKAYDLLDGLKTDAGAAKPPTVYRALEFLTRLGLAHRVETLNAFVACDVGACARATIFLLCTGCGRTEESDAGHALVDVGEAAARSGFAIERTTIEARGLCASCAAAA
ncbi:MAG: Fur family transcriptional regulator [Hyphomonadaceae bacterium]|nr:Fur family transcriptional regulator [Hyphomonadaceae bacterium]